MNDIATNVKVFRFMNDHANRGIWIGKTQTIARQLGYHRTTIRDIITEMLDVGILETLEKGIWGQPRRIRLIGPEPVSQSNRWSAERRTELRLLRESGLSYSKIARQMGITRSTITGQVRRMGLPKRPSPISRTKDGDFKYNYNPYTRG